MSLLVKDDSVEFATGDFDLLLSVVQFSFGRPIRLGHQEDAIHEGSNAQSLPVLSNRRAIQEDVLELICQLVDRAPTMLQACMPVCAGLLRPTHLNSRRDLVYRWVPRWFSQIQSIFVRLNTAGERCQIYAKDSICRMAADFRSERSYNMCRTCARMRRSYGNGKPSPFLTRVLEDVVDQSAIR